MSLLVGRSLVQMLSAHRTSSYSPIEAGFQAQVPQGIGGIETSALSPKCPTVGRDSCVHLDIQASGVHAPVMSGKHEVKLLEGFCLSTTVSSFEGW